MIPFIFSKADNAVEKISHQTPLGAQPGLAIQHCYEAPGDPRVEIRAKTQCLRSVSEVVPSNVVQSWLCGCQVADKNTCKNTH